MMMSERRDDDDELHPAKPENDQFLATTDRQVCYYFDISE
jgi:hypothetical protein